MESKFFLLVCLSLLATATAPQALYNKTGSLMPLSRHFPSSVLRGEKSKRGENPGFLCELVEHKSPLPSFGGTSFRPFLLLLGEKDREKTATRRKIQKSPSPAERSSGRTKKESSEFPAALFLSDALTPRRSLRRWYRLRSSPHCRSYQPYRPCPHLPAERCNSSTRTATMRGFYRCSSSCKSAE